MSEIYHYELKLSTPKEDFIDISREVKNMVSESNIKNGLCTVYCPHTTAGITVNENADPTVVTDMLYALDIVYPDRPKFRHMEGNSAAHLKSSAMGAQQTFSIKDGKMVLGTWQGIYFCEFDGPRSRRVHITVMGK